MPNPWSIYALIPFIWLFLVICIGMRIAIAAVMADYHADGFELGCKFLISKVQHLQYVNETTRVGLEIDISGKKEKNIMIDVLKNINDQIHPLVTITTGPSRPGVWRAEANAFMIHPDFFIERKK